MPPVNAAGLVASSLGRTVFHRYDLWSTGAPQTVEGRNPDVMVCAGWRLEYSNTSFIGD